MSTTRTCVRFRFLQSILRQSGGRRMLSTKPSTPPTSAPNPRIARIHSRLPRFLQSYTSALSNAPVSHITSFLLLHELTAVVPLFTLAGFFHYSQWMPPFISEGKWVADGMQKFRNWFRRRGWLGVVGEDGKNMARRGVWWGRSEGGVRIVVEFATAYAITKALLPLRLVFSVSATPWFARIAVIPVMNRFQRIFRRTPKATTPNDKTIVATKACAGKESVKLPEAPRE